MTIAVLDRKPVFDAFRSILGRGFKADEVTRLDNAIDLAIGIAAPAPAPATTPKVGLDDSDFMAAATRLRCTVAQIRAVWEVESGGGWFTDMRADILAADGPGGFIDGAALPKILFEAHQFARLTGGKFNASHPNVSSPRWDRGLYVGGQAEYLRLNVAMKLDYEAALKSASWGGAQIMGFNHALAGYATVDAFVAAMKASETNHLLAFCTFIEKSGLGAALRNVSNVHADNVALARGYNGEGYASHDPGYHIRIARAHKKWSGS